MGNFVGEGLFLTISVIGNLSIAWFFASPSARIFAGPLPADYGMLIFVMEFLNVHSTAMAFGAQTGTLQVQTQMDFIKKNPKMVLVGFYGLTAFMLGYFLKNWILPAYFGIGLISKFFGRKATHDARGIAHMILLLLFSFVLGMRLWPGVAFFMFIWTVGFIFLAAPSFPLWRGWVAKRNLAIKADPRLSDPDRQLFRDKLDFLRYSMPLLLFVPFYSLSLLNSEAPPGEIFCAVLYFPSLAAGDIA